MEHIFGSMPEADIKHIMRIVERLQSSGTAEEVVADLELLRDFVDQIDNAIDFGTIGGYKMLLELVGHEDSDVRKQVWWTLGEACSNNPQAISLAIQDGSIEAALKGLEAEEDEAVLVKMIYALATMIRQHADAQRLFSNMDGAVALKEAFHTVSQRAKTKILTLIADTIVLSPWKILFTDNSWCNLFRSGIMTSEASYQSLTNSLKFYSNTEAKCSFGKRFRKRLLEIKKEWSRQDDFDEEIVNWVKLILQQRKQQRTEGSFQALPQEEHHKKEL